MRPVLSPAESLGLSGATLEGRVRRAAHHVADPTFARISERLKADAFANGMIYEHDGVPEAIRVMLRPLLGMSEQFDYVHYVCLRLIEALKILPQLYLDDENIRKIIAISPDPNERSQKVAEGLRLSFRFLADRDLAVTRRYGLAHAGAGPDGGDVPRPATVVLDRDGVVRCFSVSRNVQVRPDPDDVLRAVRAL